MALSRAMDVLKNSVAFARRHGALHLAREVHYRLDNLWHEQRFGVQTSGMVRLAELGIRVGTLADSSLVARKICDVERVVCASPAYLRRHGTPRKAEDLLRHNCLNMSNSPALRRWPFATPEGVTHLEVSGNVNANTAESLLQLALLGVGVIRLSDAIVGAAIGEGKLVALLREQHHAEPLPLHAVYPHGRHRSPRVAAMIEFLVERFGGAPWRTPAKRKAR